MGNSSQIYNLQTSSARANKLTDWSLMLLDDSAKVKKVDREPTIPACDVNIMV